MNMKFPEILILSLGEFQMSTWEVRLPYSNVAGTPLIQITMQMTALELCSLTIYSNSETLFDGHKIEQG